MGQALMLLWTRRLGLDPRWAEWWRDVDADTARAACFGTSKSLSSQSWVHHRPCLVSPSTRPAVAVVFFARLLIPPPCFGLHLPSRSLYVCVLGRLQKTSSSKFAAA